MTSPRQTEWMSRTVDSFMTMQQDEGVDPPGPQSFKDGMCGYLLKLYGKGTHRVWRKKWFYLMEDRLCYTEDEDTLGPIKYLPLDRIPVRPYPRGYKPDIGVSILTGNMLSTSKTFDKCCFSIQCGESTHFLAADTNAEAQRWVEALVEAWRYYVQNDRRMSHGMTGTMRTETMRTTRTVGGSYKEELDQTRASLQHLESEHARKESELHRQWLAAQERAIAAEQALARERARTELYRFEIHTGDRKGAGTDARVFLEVLGAGPGQSSGELWPGNSKGYPPGHKLFQRGAVDIFELPGGSLPGEMRGLRVGHDGSGASPGWFLEKVVVTRGGAGVEERKEFVCGRWLSASEEDGKLVRELSAGGATSSGSCRYEVTVRTSDLKGAGTAAPITCSLRGTKGESGPHLLEKSSTDFQRGSVDVFLVEARDLGDVSEVVIGHDGRTAADSWHCEQVEIRVKGDNPFGVLSPTGSGNFSSVGLLEKSGGATGRDSPRQKDGAKRSLEATGSDSPRQRDAGNKGVEATGKKDRAFFFPAEQWFDATQGDGLTRRVLRVSRDDPRASLVGYLFRVTTSGIRGAGTDASVFVELLGEGKLSSGEKQLQSKTGEFAAGSTEEVKLTAKDVGPLSRARLRVRHDNSGLAPDWHLDLVEVVNTKTGERAYFHCGQWLSKLLGDRQIARELQAVLKDPRKERTRCKVVIHTSDLRGAGTSASVSLDFSVNKSAPILLPAGPEAFSRGSENTFFVDVPAQVTELNRVTVSHDNTGPNPGWHLDFLEVVPHFECSCSACEKGGTASGYSGGERKQSAGKKTVYFPSKKWFDKEKDDGLISRELLASTTDPRKETLTYKVTVVTGSCKGAGTDSEVSITLIGDKADNGLARVLQGPPGAFSRGSRDVFTLPLSNLGELKKVRIGHDGKGLQPGWFLDSVEVELGEKKWYFPCQSWLGSPDGGKLQSPVVKELVAASRGSSLASGGSGNIYRVSITTSDLKGASCDANVSVTIFGEKGDSGSRPLEKPGSFNRGQTDEFFLECEQALGELVRIRLGHDGSGLSPSWHVADVRVATMGYSPGSPKPDLVLKEWLFVCGNWFDTKHGDRQTVRELTPVAKGEKVAPLVQYELAVYTSDVKGAGTDATVHVTLFGDVSNTSPRTLSCGPEAFERGACDRFVIEAADVGPLRKLRIGHDGKGARAEWHLDRVEISVKTPGSKTGVGAAAAKAPIYTFPCGRWLAKGREDGAIERELLAGGGGGKVSYKVTVYTGGDKGSGTDADVAVTFAGERGESGPHKLLGTGDLFERGQVDDFSIETNDVGDLKTLRVELLAAGTKESWLLDLIVVEAFHPTGPEKKALLPGRRWFFPCRQWLGERKTGGLSCLLPASAQDPREKRRRYRVVTITSDLKGAATDANVSMTLYGVSERGRVPIDSGVRKLVANGTGAFTRGHRDEFELECEDLGELQKIRIEHDGTGKEPGWHLAEVRVQSLGSAKTGPLDSAGNGGKSGGPEKEQVTKEWVFPCDKWLDARHGDRLTARELFPAGLSNAVKRTVKYKLKLYTSDVKGAGTDADIAVVFLGESGSTGEPLKLPATQEAFERGSCDEFTLDAADVGSVKTLRIGHNNTGPSPAWHLDRAELEVLDFPGQGGKPRKYLFPCGKWFDAQRGDRLTQRDLAAVDFNTNARGVYTVTCHTTDLPGAGTDAGVAVLITGEKGISGPHKLEANGALKAAFERGRVDTFKLPECEALGKLISIRIGHDGRGTHPAWHLDFVEVHESASNQTWYFPCNQWIDEACRLTAPSSAGANPLLNRELLASVRDPRLDRRVYSLTTFTTDLKAADTDANVTATLYGEKGNSGVIKLVSPSLKSAFQRGQKDTFSVTCQDLGEVTKIRIGHDNTGQSPNWHLTEARLSEPGSGKAWVFPCGQWFDADDGDRQIVRELFARPADSCNYTVTVYTSNIEGAGTDAHVSMTLYGEKGDTKKLRLPAKRHAFERGGIDTFQLTSKDVGKIWTLRIGHDNRGSRPAWHLDRVQVVVEGDTCGIYYFPVDQWFDANRGDGLVEREIPAQSTEPKKRVKYTVRVYTSDTDQAEADGEVSVVLREKTGAESGPHKLSSGDISYFQRGAEDVFLISCASKLSDLSSLLVVFDGKTSKSKWHLELISVEEDATGRKWFFPCGQWIGAVRTGQKLQLGAVDTDPRLEKHRYKFEITTSNVEGAGTDGDVFVTLVGERGQGKEHVLESADDDFSRGKEDTFFVTDRNLGRLQKLRISHNGDEGWHLARARVTNLDTDARATFVCNNWIENGDPEQRTERELVAADERDLARARETYLVRIYTSDRANAGTDATVSFVVYGEGGESAEQRLPGSRGRFARGAKTEHTFECEDLGALERLRVWHDNKGLGAGWHLAHIIVTAGGGAGAEYLFKCNRWLDKREDDHRIERELFVEKPPPPAPAEIPEPSRNVSFNRTSSALSQQVGSPRQRERKEVEYRFTIMTGARMFAGTNARVYASLFGDMGNSGPSNFVQNPNSFQRGCRDTFVVRTLDVGFVKALRLGHDGSGFFPGWFCESVDVQNVTSGQQWHFECRMWLDKRRGDGRIERDLLPSAIPGRTSAVRSPTSTIVPATMARGQSVTIGRQ